MLISEGEQFGASVAACQEFRVVVGAPKNSILFREAGRVYTYELRRNVSLSWVSSDAFPSMGSKAGDQFGASVAMSRDGTIFIAGAPASVGMNSTGYIEIYSWEEVSWKSIASINGTQADELFGSSVVMLSGSSVFAVGAPFYENGRGRVAVYQKDESSGGFIQIGPSIVGDSGEELGSFGSLSGGFNNMDQIVIVVGSKLGSVKSFKYSNETQDWQPLYQDIMINSTNPAAISFSSNTSYNQIVVGNNESNNLSIFTADI